MTWKLSNEERVAVTGLPAHERYAYFVKRVADWEAVWCLRNAEGWVTFADDMHHICVPFWPHPEFARSNAKDAWRDTSPEEIALDDFLDKWLPGMTRDARLAAVFPSPLDNAAVVPASQLAGDLRSELEKIE